jgi:hypothetical protein
MVIMGEYWSLGAATGSRFFNPSSRLLIAAVLERERGAVQ